MPSHSLRTFLAATMSAALLTLGLLAAAPRAHAEGAQPKILKKVPPEFPVEAARKNITDGRLKAKVTIDGQGSVTDVQIVEAIPAAAKVFSASATTALAKWKFEPSGKGEAFEVMLVFSQE